MAKFKIPKSTKRTPFQSSTPAPAPMSSPPIGRSPMRMPPMKAGKPINRAKARKAVRAMGLK